MLPVDFYDREPVVAMLAGYEFGRFLLTVRGLTGWSQQTLGGVVGMDQSQISAVERGEHRLHNIETVAGMAQGLKIPPVMLNFPDIRATVSTAGVTVRKVVSWVDRRDFGQHIAGMVLSIAGAAGLDIDRLLALLPQPEPTGSRHVGTADVEIIEQVTAAFRSQDFSHGSGPICDAAVAQLRATLPLLKSQMDPELRPRLQLAVAELAAMAGWMSFDVLDHDAARRLWVIGLDLARSAEHPFGADLSVYLLGDMALQSLHLDRPEEAHHLIRVGQAAPVGRSTLSANTAGLFRNIESQVHAAQGDAAGCDRAQGQALEQLGRIDPVTAPPWTTYVGKVGISGGLGAAHGTLAMIGRDARAADRAVPLLRQAVGRFGSGHAKLGAWYLPNLSGAHALAGDLGTALTIGHQAVDAVTAVSSPLVRDRLRVLYTTFEPMSTSPGVAELRERLVTTAA